MGTQGHSKQRGAVTETLLSNPPGPLKDAQFPDELP